MRAAPSLIKAVPNRARDAGSGAGLSPPWLPTPPHRTYTEPTSAATVPVSVSYCKDPPRTPPGGYFRHETVSSTVARDMPNARQPNGEIKRSVVAVANPAIAAGVINPLTEPLP